MILETEDDFDPGKIAASGQCFRWQEEASGFRVAAFGKMLHLRRLKNGKWRLSCSRRDFDRIWGPYFDLSTDYRGIRAMIPPEDAFLCRAAEYARGIRILRQDPWETLITFIISQNRNIPAIRRSVELICSAAGTPVSESGWPSSRAENSVAAPPSPAREREIFHAFPTPEQIAGMSGEALDACRLGYRRDYVRRAAEDAASGRLDLSAIAELPEQDQLKRLTEIYGVGKKVAGCVMLFGFHDLNAFPMDVWIRRVLEREYGGAEQYPFAQYAPYNGVMQQYLFEYGRKIEKNRIGGTV
jgi:N-glycosylase/DNA lyase